MKTKEVKSFSEADTSGLKQPIICVYSHPADYPEKCVARIFDGTAPTDTIITRDTGPRINCLLQQAGKIIKAWWKAGYREGREGWDGGRKNL